MTSLADLRKLIIDQIDIGYFDETTDSLHLYDLSTKKFHDILPFDYDCDGDGSSNTTMASDKTPVIELVEPFFGKDDDVILYITYNHTPTKEQYYNKFRRLEGEIDQDGFFNGTVVLKLSTLIHKGLMTK